MQDKFKLKEVFNNGDYKICCDSYKTIRAGRVAGDKQYGQSDFVWACHHLRCALNQRAYPLYADYVAWVDECNTCHKRYFIIKTNSVFSR